MAKEMKYVGMKVEDVIAKFEQEGIVYEYDGEDGEGEIYVGGYWADGDVLVVEDGVIVDEEYFEWGEDL